MEEKSILDQINFSELKEKHLCPICGKVCKLSGKSTRKNPKWNLFCSYECKYSPLGKQITSEIFKKHCLEKYGVENPALLKDVVEKRKKTFKEKYGVENPLQNKEIMEKRKQTCLDRYGVENPFQLELFKSKYKQTMEKRYREKIPLRNNDIKEKCKQTCLDRYGVENPSQNEEIKEKKKQTCLKNYGVECIFKDEKQRTENVKKFRKTHWNLFIGLLNQKNIKPLFEINDYVEQNECSHIFYCIQCEKKFTVEENNTRPQKIYCPESVHNNRSLSEQEIYDWLVSIGITNIERNKRDWKCDKIFEADIYLPDYKLVIEYNGLYWHSNLNHNKDYHFNKWKFFKEQNIECIQIFENEWKEKKEIVKSIILNKLGKNKRIFARKCIIKEIPSVEYELFLEQNHLQGYCLSKVKLGLFHQDELVEVMSFSKPRFNKKYDWENIRTCTKIGYNIVGGFSKLLNYFKKNYSGSIISYIDSRYFSGDGYLKNGFQYMGHSKPNYFYFKGNTLELFSRNIFQKHKLKNKLEIYNENFSEKENMSMNNYLWIYDCGSEIVTSEEGQIVCPDAI